MEVGGAPMWCSAVGSDFWAMQACAWAWAGPSEGGRTLARPCAASLRKHHTHLLRQLLGISRKLLQLTRHIRQLSVHLRRQVAGMMAGSFECATGRNPTAPGVDAFDGDVRKHQGAPPRTGGSSAG